jgi:stearoyl-CoA desaturase (delta-9 desaturase)
MMNKLLKYLAPSLEFSTLLQLSLPLGLYLGMGTGAGWTWWVLAFFMYGIVYAMIGNNIAMHRYFSHRHFEVTKPVEWLFVWCGSMIGLGSPISYAITHTVHHNPKYTDTPLDPHGPARGKRSIIVYFQRIVDPKDTPFANKRIVELSRKWGWLHRFYVPFVLVNAAILWLISYKIFLFVWFIPASMAIWGISFSILRQHWPMSANNCPTHRWEPLYEALHKNHHNYPGAPNTVLRKNEIDWTYQFSRLFRPKYNWKGQPPLRND